MMTGIDGVDVEKGYDKIAVECLQSRAYPSSDIYSVHCDVQLSKVSSISRRHIFVDVCKMHVN